MEKKIKALREFPLIRGVTLFVRAVVGKQTEAVKAPVMTYF